MEENVKIRILKEAILFERRGKAFYEKVAEQTDNTAVKDFFLMMAQEEENHVQILMEQFSKVNAGETFSWNESEEKKYGEVSEMVINPDFVKEIDAAAYEAAAISAAISMERNAIELYQERADSSDDADEKRLYNWLANWEKSHLVFLAEIDKQLTEEVWFENQFWSF